MAQQTHLTAPATSALARSKFYPVMAGLILLIVVAGFVPTLYLRPLFDVPAIPPYLYVHGILLTAWFVLFFVQTMLVARGSTVRHRELGIAAVAIGAVIPLAGSMATFGVLSRFASLGVVIDDSTINSGANVVFENLLDIAFFSTALLAAFLLRRRRDFHSRLMLWGTLLIITPALARIYRWPIVPDIGEVRFSVIALYLLMAAIVVHELWREKRVHVVTVIALSVWTGWRLVKPWIVSTEWAQDFVRSLV